jgi:uncharacterized 2Fe-2S/4Fe-4S cluster protein (DUF4445 family)
MGNEYSIVFEPVGRRGKIPAGQTLLEAARQAGVGLVSICGGAGTCEACKVRLIEGRLTSPSLVEQAVLNSSELANGVRLACQAEALSDIKVNIPPASLTAPQRLQLEGWERILIPDPANSDPEAYGLAVDIGTTKIAAYLVQLSSGKTIGRAGAMNPQVSYGEDVISRIAYCIQEPQGRLILQSTLMETINQLLVQLQSDARIASEQIREAVFVGNTAMHHLAAGLPVEQLGKAPFSPATTEPITLTAADLKLSLGSSASIYFPPVVAGYVGSDHIAMLLATDADQFTGNAIALDIGTNTEISLVVNGKITCCSCASGPAFEGAHIHEGMRAAPGAIERAHWSNGHILWQTIHADPPIGICGSGILDIVAALQDGGQLKSTGAFRQNSVEYCLVPAEETGLYRDLVVTRKDVHEIQLAKSAIRAGIETLLKGASISAAELDKFIVAGAFGTYLDIRSAIRVGMFPALPVTKFEQVGNAAGAGAKQMLISRKERQKGETIARQLHYIELTTQSAFSDLFIKNLSLEA